MLFSQKPKPTTKLVRVNLMAYARVTYSEVIEVPAELTNEQLAGIAHRRIDDVDRRSYVVDPDHWDHQRALFSKVKSGSSITHKLQPSGYVCPEPAPLPIVVVEIKGGMVNCVDSNSPVEIITLDEDSDGCERVVLVQGKPVLANVERIAVPSLEQVAHCAAVSAEVKALN